MSDTSVLRLLVSFRSVFLGFCVFTSRICAGGHFGENVAEFRAPAASLGNVLSTKQPICFESLFLFYFWGFVQM